MLCAEQMSFMELLAYFCLHTLESGGSLCYVVDEIFMSTCLWNERNSGVKKWMKYSLHDFAFMGAFVMPRILS